MSTAIAVMGILAGALLTGVLQHFAQRAQRMAQEAAERRSAGMDAVAALCVALADHRAAMLGSGNGPARGGRAGAGSGGGAADAVGGDGPAGASPAPCAGAGEAARQAVGAVFGMREAQSAVELQEARERAAVAAEEVVAVGRGVLV